MIQLIKRENKKQEPKLEEIKAIDNVISIEMGSKGKWNLMKVRKMSKNQIKNFYNKNKTGSILHNIFVGGNTENFITLKY